MRIPFEDITPFFSVALAHCGSQEEYESIINDGKKRINKPNERFVVGKTYSLGGDICDEFIMDIKEYKLLHIINDLSGISMNTLVMKQVNGERGTIFSLSKNDCRLLGIPFEKGLQSFPMAMDWKEVVKEEKKEEEVKKAPIPPSKINLLTNPNKLTEYPKNPHTNRVEVITFKVKVPQEIINEEENGINCLNTLNVTFSQFTCPYRFITKRIDDVTIDNNENITTDGYMYVEVDVREPFLRFKLDFRNEFAALRNFSFNYSLLTKDEKRKQIVDRLLVELAKSRKSKSSDWHTTSISTNYNNKNNFKIR